MTNLMKINMDALEKKIRRIVFSDILSDEEKYDLVHEEFKKWRSKPASSNVNEMLYNDETEELVIKFNDGSYYTYYDVPNLLFRKIFQARVRAKTSGENRWGRWWVGKIPSVGAAVHKYLVNSGIRYEKGGSLR